ncbi:hypothetical protein [Enterococcus sp. 5H]|uniref:hypothetical protein n=1 Tax=Enterococcus sp. 5H TaxID=1229490 RepID=UPI0023038ADC|nr:hypothetical protein [Enterococcus sp. 5H]MDA9470055.1 hypothetical protein [Enterococcus sp. 5H]
MKKKYLGVLLLFSLLSVGCSKKQPTKTEDSDFQIKQSESTTKKSESTTEVTSSSTSESIVSSSIVQQTTASLENEVQEQVYPEVVDNTNEENETNSENYYYNFIKDVKQRQVDYINSIEDPHIKQSVQTSQSAAISASNSLLLENPRDADIIKEALQKVLNE